MKTTAEERAAMRQTVREIREKQAAEQKALKGLRLTAEELEGLVLDAPTRRKTWARMATRGVQEVPREEEAAA